MQFFTKFFSLILVAITLPLLFLPKINLLSVGGKETAGIRFDDVVLLLVAMIIFWGHFILRKPINKIEKWIFIITGFSLLSFTLNRIFVAAGLLTVDANIFYCFRLVEYFIFFYIGAMASRFLRTSTVIRAFFLWNLVLMLLQKMELIGQFSFGGYDASAAVRVVGVGSFPSETGMFMVIAFCYLAFNDEKSRYFNKVLPPNMKEFFSKTHVYWLFLICSALVIFTGSRIAIVALIVAFFDRIKTSIDRRSVGTWVLAAFFIAIGTALSTHLILKNKAIIERSFGLLSFANFDLIKLAWDSISIAHDPIGNETVKYESYDLSWWLRIHKWMYALKIYVINPECWLQGVGPGFAMAALDGGFLRILTEYGIIGCYLFWKLFSTVAKQSKQLFWIVVAFAINMIFFDVYMAYKPMSLLFFISGSTMALAREKAGQEGSFALNETIA